MSPTRAALPSRPTVALRSDHVHEATHTALLLHCGASGGTAPTSRRPSPLGHHRRSLHAQRPRESVAPGACSPAPLGTKRPWSSSWSRCLADGVLKLLTSTPCGLTPPIRCRVVPSLSPASRACR